MGYHTKEIEKGVYGEVSKIQEEMDEFLDAWGQQAKLLMLCELADLYGAIAGFVEKQFPGMTMTDIEVMSRMTKEAFEAGERGAPTTIVVSTQEILEESRANLRRCEKNGKCSWCDNEGELGPPEDRYLCPCGRKS